MPSKWKLERWQSAGRSRPITNQQHVRLLDHWLAEIGLEPALFGTHFLRRTKAIPIYRRTGKLRAVQLLLCHRERRTASATKASSWMTISQLQSRSEQHTSELQSIIRISYAAL